MSKPPAAKRLCVDFSSTVFELVIGSGFFPWYELNDECRVVSKGWNEAISTALNNAPFFKQLVEHIGKLNCCNKCEWCNQIYSEKSRHVFCMTNAGSDERALKEKDPRCQDSFDSLSSFEKARRLYLFHAKCISNLLSFYGEELSIEESLCARYCIPHDWFCGMTSLRDYNPNAHWLFMGLVELHIAKIDLAQGTYWYKPAFAGRERSAGRFTGSSYYGWTHDIVLEKLNGAPHEADERSFDAFYVTRRSGERGRWYKSQFNHLEDIIKGMLNERDLVADQLLGEQLANRIDIMHKARDSMIPRLPDIFPLEWMPVFEDDYMYAIP